ncbi:uncharacterized protein LOC125652943 isoform X2 [Ostrea edulis]|uniref:uncharacterized protein LOC125652943 isoform X2 n=1 Tax=Ostrea edulis TaxID=37623 RepID=UPI0024AEA895|nr:uncharacterized protein LOC125652943 isoform X2 [Ostrea edulis]
MSLHMENLIPTGPYSIQNALDALSQIKRELTKNPEARTVLLTWLLTVRRQHKPDFLYNERIHGLQVLFEYESQGETFHDDEAVHNWLEKLSLEILKSDARHSSEKLGANSVFTALHCALMRQSKSQHNAYTIESWMLLKETLKMSISNYTKSTKELHEFSKGNDWKEIVRTEPILQANLPFFLVFAAEMFSVRVCILCYPSKEEVTFHPTKPTDTVIRIGLVHKDHYVCLIPKEKEKTNADNVKGLEKSIRDLKKSIHEHEQQINELKKEKKKNNAKIIELSAEKEKLERELEEKEREKARLIDAAQKRMEAFGMKLTQMYVGEIARQLENLDVEI